MHLKKQLISMNYSKGVSIVPQYIVIHETANTSIGANAQRHFLYWNSNAGANSSVHFVCDDTEVIQLCELDWRCWHVGDGDGSSGITNDNAIGIEICVNADGDYMKARQNAIDLVKWLLPIVGLTPDKVVRHKDATGKYCPIKMLDKPELWHDFVRQIGGTPMLKKGDTGEAVSDLQAALNEFGAGLIIDGDFGPATEAAVKAFQAANALTADGIAGAATITRLDAVIAAMQTPVIDYKSKFEAFLSEIEALIHKYKS